MNIDARPPSINNTCSKAKGLEKNRQGLPCNIIAFIHCFVGCPFISVSFKVIVEFIPVLVHAS